MSNNYDIILAGGGIMGSAIAYNLIKRDATLRVLVIERDSTYEFSSTTRSDGNIRIQFDTEANIRISQYGMQVLETFAEEFATAEHTPAIDFRKQGNLYMVTEKIYDLARAGVVKQQSLGCDVVWLERDEIKEVYPLLEVHDNILGATFGRNDGSMSPLAVLQGYRRKATELGVTYLEADVAALLKDGNQMTGLRLKNGDVYNAPIVFNVTGAWAPILAETVGVSLPIDSLNRQVWSVETDAHFDEILPMLLLPTGQFIFHEGGSHFIAGGSSPSDFVTYDNFGWSRQRFEDEMWESLVHYLPAFDRLKVASGWSGLYAINTFDHNAILGEWLGLKGYYCANGFSGHGFQQSHAVGRYSAELVLGLPHAMDLSRLLATRIQENNPIHEHPARLI
ncbi:MAG: NAD(P)/FAD-dependent oxidoreductase [Candidatus Promineifilaceae bacterium]